MKIKALTVTVILSMVVAARAHSFGLGAQLNLSAGRVFAPGAALVISPSDMTHMAINWYFDFNQANTLGLTLDVCPLNLPITTFSSGSFNFTLGVGFFTNVVLTNDTGINVGLRVPVGFNVMLGKVFEIYTHVAPSFGVDFLPNLGFSYPFFPIALGARFWFGRSR